MTAQKDQLSIWPSDIELSQAVDTNYLAGMIWGRTPQVRLTWRPSTHINWAVSAGESGAAARKWIGGTPRVLRERYRRPVQHRVRRAQGAQLDDRIL